MRYCNKHSGDCEASGEDECSEDYVTLISGWDRRQKLSDVGAHIGPRLAVDELPASEP
jgi:hypothetical protein